MLPRSPTLLFSILCCTTLAIAQDRYVSVGGSNSSNGQSLATPWRTLTYAAATAPSGSRIHVGPGTFGTDGVTEGIELKAGKKLYWHGSGIGKTIILANKGFTRPFKYHYSGGATTVSYTAIFVVHGAGTVNDIWDMTLDAKHLPTPTRLACVVYADGASGLLRRVEMRNAGAAIPDGNQRRVAMIANGKNVGAASSITLRDCYLHHWNKSGIVMGGKRLTCTVQNSVIEGSGRMGAGKAAQNGIQIMDGASGYTIQDNIIRDVWYLPATWNSVGILNLRSGSTTKITGNRIFNCKTGYYHLELPTGQVTFDNNRVASCQWGVTSYSNRLSASGNHFDSDVGVYVGGATSPVLSGNYYSSFRQNSGYPSKYIADGNTAVQDTTPLTKPLGFKPATKINLGAGAGPEDLVTGDFNADGKLDFAVAEGGTNKVSIHFGSGGSNFSTIPAVSVTVPGRPIRLATGEFTGTTGLDLVCLAQSGKAYVLKNSGTGLFSRGTAFQVIGATDNPSSIASANIDSLKQDDFVVGYRGNGYSTGGGIKILYVSNSVISVGASLSGTLRSIEDVAVADINGDSKPDILAVDTSSNAGANNKLQVWIRKTLTASYGAMTSYSIGTMGRGLSLGDLDRDGDLDVAVCRSGSLNGWVQVFEGQGSMSPSGTFAEASQSPFRIDTDAERISMVDLQDDADPDTRRLDVVVTHPAKNSMSRLRQWVDGRFQSYRGAYTGLDPRAFAFAHLDSDQLPDLLLAMRGDHVVTVALDDADAVLQSYGVGGSGIQGRVPELFVSPASSLPSVGNMGFVIDVRNARPLSAGIFLFTADSSISTIPCQIQVSLLSLFLLPIVPLDRYGNGVFAMPIPTDPKLVGLDFYTQLAVLDAAGCFVNTFSLSQGIRLRVGH